MDRRHRDRLTFLISLVPANTAFARCACTLVRRSGEGMLIFSRAKVRANDEASNCCDGTCP
eukprot:3815081-Pyramimonas_sp.AAC.1